jgi:hypothetical protein
MSELAICYQLRVTNAFFGVVGEFVLIAEKTRFAATPRNDQSINRST